MLAPAEHTEGAHSGHLTVCAPESRAQERHPRPPPPPHQHMLPFRFRSLLLPVSPAPLDLRIPGPRGWQGRAPIPRPVPSGLEKLLWQPGRPYRSKPDSFQEQSFLQSPARWNVLVFSQGTRRAAPAPRRHGRHRQRRRPPEARPAHTAGSLHVTSPKGRLGSRRRHRAQGCPKGARRWGWGTPAHARPVLLAPAARPVLHAPLRWRRRTRESSKVPAWCGSSLEGPSRPGGG